MDGRALDLVDAGDPRVETIWRTLEGHGQPSYFLSWGWIENWLAALPVDERPQLAVVHRDDTPAAAFFLARRTTRRNLVQQKRALYFNTTGSRRHDEIGIEHNRMLAAPGAGRSLATILDLIPGEWDELHLPAVDRYAFDDVAGVARRLGDRYQVTVEREASAPFVDLEAVRAVDGGYEQLLPASTRVALRRSRAEIGALDVEVAADARHAMDIYGELLRLHARRWAARGMRGAFADPWFERFHRRLILSRLAHGEIQLVRVRSGGETVGCLYNFVHRGRILFYQCGLASYEDERVAQVKPGYVCHAAAIEHNALAGHETYELLGGHAAYKENLSTGANQLLWLRVQRGSAPVSSVEDTVRRWYELLVGDRPQLALRPA